MAGINEIIASDGSICHGYADELRTLYVIPGSYHEKNKEIDGFKRYTYQNGALQVEEIDIRTYWTNLSDKGYSDSEEMCSGKGKKMEKGKEKLKKKIIVCVVVAIIIASTIFMAQYYKRQKILRELENGYMPFTLEGYKKNFINLKLKYVGQAKVSIEKKSEFEVYTMKEDPRFDGETLYAIDGYLFFLDKMTFAML